jgi:hypothetical protein
MDPAVAALDFARAGAILADMVETFLAAGIPASLLEGADHDDVKDNRPAPVARGLHLHSPVDAGTSALQPAEHRAPVQSQEQAQALGWSPEKIRSLDRDLGQSATTSREDFKTLAELGQRVDERR